MILLIKLTFAFLVPFLLGYAILKLCFDKPYFSKTLVLGLSFGLGAGILSQWILLLSTFHIPYSYKTIALPQILFAGICFWLLFTRKRRLVHSNIQPKLSVKFDFWILLASAYVLYYTCFIFWQALSWPIYLWDAINLHAYKGKVFFFSNSLECLPSFPYSGYPLHIPFQLFWTAMNIGAWDEQILKIIFPINYVMFMCVNFGFLILFVKRNWAWIAMALMVSSSIFTMHATIAYSDFMLMFYNCTTIILLLIWSRYKDDRLLILASLFVGFASFTKLEGVGMIAVHSLIVMYILYFDNEIKVLSKLKQFIKFCVPAGLIYGHSIVYKLFNFPQINETSSSAGKMFLESSLTWPNWERAGILTRKILENMVLTNNWSVLWFVLFVLIVLRLSAREKISRSSERPVLLLGLVLTLSYYFLGLLFTSRFNFVANDSLLSRGFLSFFPFIVYLILFFYSSAGNRNGQLKENQDGRSTIGGWLYLIISWLISLIIFLGYFYLLSGRSTGVTSLLKDLALSLYFRPSMNIFYIDTIYGLNVNVLLYALFIFTTCLIILVMKIISDRNWPLDKISAESIIKKNVLIMLMMAVMMQAYAHYDYFRSQMKSRVEPDAFYARVYGRRYNFIRHVRKYLPSNASIALNFESKIEDDPQDFEKLIFNYFLYPAGDIRHVCSDKKPYDYVIITDKYLENNSILKNYEVIYGEDDMRLFQRRSGNSPELRE